MDQNTLIALLNDIAGGDSAPIPGGNEPEIFFNADGQPTDRFLEALKMDLKQLPDFPKDARKQTLPSSTEYAAKSSPVQDQRSRRERDVSYSSPSPSRSPSPSPPRRLGRAHSPSPTRSAGRVSSSYEHETYASMRRSRSFSPPPRRHASPVKAVKVKKVKMIKKKATSSSSSSKAFPGPASSTLFEDVCEEHSVIACKRCHSRHRMSKLTTRASIPDSKILPTAASDILCVENVEAEAKIRSLELRLQGQLHTIKALEQQHAAAVEQVAIAQRIITQLQAKNRTLAEASSSAQAYAAKDATQAAEGVRMMDVVDQLKHQVRALQSKLADETAKRQRSEERARAFREYADKAKAQCGVYEDKSAELKAAAVEMTQKMGKYRKSYRDLAAEVSALQSEIVSKEAEAHRQAKRAATAESELLAAEKKVEMLRSDHHQAQQRILDLEQTQRHLHLQMEIREEREASRKMEQRLALAPAARSPPPAPTSAQLPPTRQGRYAYPPKVGISPGSLGDNTDDDESYSHTEMPSPALQLPRAHAPTHRQMHTHTHAQSHVRSTRMSRNMVMRMAAASEDEQASAPSTSAALVVDNPAIAASSSSRTDTRSASPQRLRAIERASSVVPVATTTTSSSSTGHTAPPFEEEKIIVAATNQTVQLVRAIAERALLEQGQEQASISDAKPAPASSRPPMASPESLVDYPPPSTAARAAAAAARPSITEDSVLSAGSSGSGLARFERLQQLYDKVTSRSSKPK